MTSPRMHHGQVDLDVPRVRRLLAEQAPEFADLPLRRVAAGGTENAVFRLGDELAVRLPLLADAVEGVLKEVRWLREIAPHLTLDVPEVVAVGGYGEAYPFPWTVVRWLPGEDATVARPRSLVELAGALGGFVAELHAIDASSAPPPGSAGFVRGRPIVHREEAFHDALARCGGLVDVPRVVEVWEDALATPEWDGAPVWLHADLIPANLLLRDGRLAGVLDFGALATGDPAYDLIPAWFALDREAREVFRETVGCDDDAWRRARGLVISQSVIALPYYLHTNPTMVHLARTGIDAVLDETS